MSFAAMFTRLRRHDRDKAVDAARLASVLASLDMAIAGIDAEARGLGARVAAGRELAGHLLGSEDGCLTSRERDHEQALVEAERVLRQGTDRLASLAQTRARFSAVREALTSTREGDVGPAAATDHSPTTTRCSDRTIKGIAI